MSEPVVLRLLGGKRVTLSDALNRDSDVLVESNQREVLLEFCRHLHSNYSQIADLVSRHLGIPHSDLTICAFKDWLVGGYNICLPILINGHPKLPRRVMIRFAQPSTVGETFYPGNVEEKFTTLETESLWNRLVWHFRRLWTGRALAPYFGHHRNTLCELGYLIIEHVEEGNMLSDTWEEHQYDSKRRANLFRGLAQTLLSLAKNPLPRIGSWTLDDHGIISLTNRPLALLMHQFASHAVPIDIPRNLTYSSVEPWVLDMLACQDNRMRHQPNAIHDRYDARFQLGALVGLRALLPQLVNRRARGGPFVLTLTDLNANNIFVDDDWHVTRIIDLEFACVLPMQMWTVPHWLTNRGIDQLTGTDLEEYKPLYDEFVDAVKHEEDGQKLVNQCGDMSCSQMLRETWATGRLWYSHALWSTNGFPQLFTKHLLPRFGGDLVPEAKEALMNLWCENAEDFATEKIAEQDRYEKQVEELFAAAAAKQAAEKAAAAKPEAETAAAAKPEAETAAAAKPETETAAAAKPEAETGAASIGEDEIVEGGCDRSPSRD